MNLVAVAPTAFDRERMLAKLYPRGMDFGELVWTGRTRGGRPSAAIGKAAWTCRGAVAPTGRRTTTSYVYVRQFEAYEIAYMTRIWKAGHALKDLGWP